MIADIATRFGLRDNLLYDLLQWYYKFFILFNKKKSK